MAKLMSKKTRENVVTITVLVIIALIVIFYIIYPLITVNKMTTRPDSNQFDDPEFTLQNDPAVFVENALVPDTFDVATVDNIRLAAAYFYPDSAVFDSIRATAILIHDAASERGSMIPYIQPLLDSGIAVVVYDQRSCGLSGGQYFTPGIFEAEDLNQVIIDLKFHDRIYRPLIAVGFGIGADAAILASEEESRLDNIIAVDPYLTPNRWIRLRKEERGSFTIPFYTMTYYWWYKKITGFPYDRYGADDMQPLTTATMLLISEDKLEDSEIARLNEISNGLLTTKIRPVNDEQLSNMILNNVYTVVHGSHITE